MKRLLIFISSLVLAGKLFSQETPIYWEYFEPEVDYARRLRITGATSQWGIVAEPTADKTASSLKLTFDFSKQKKVGYLVFDIPMLAFDRISFRVWNPNPPDVPIYLHLTASHSINLGAFSESVAFASRYYGDTTPAPDASLFIRPNTPSAPLPSSAKVGWIPIEVRFPKDIADVSNNGKHRPVSQEEQTDWKKNAFPTVTALIEMKSPESSNAPITLYFDDVEFYLSK